MQRPRQPQPLYVAPGQWSGLLQRGNLDLLNRPVVRNRDGSISTVRSISVTDDQGHAYLLPTVIGNRVVSPQQAVRHFQQTGQHLGYFLNEHAANNYGMGLHAQQAILYGGR